MDLLAAQGTLKSLFQHHSLKASILRQSAFFIQLSYLYTTTGKTITLTRGTFVCKVMSLLFNILFSFVIAFLLRSKHLLISWLQSQSAVILESRKKKPVTDFFVSPSICNEMMGSEVKSLSRVRLFPIPWTAAHQAPLYVEFPRQEYWGRLPFPSPGDLPGPGIKPRSPAWQAVSLPLEAPEILKLFPFLPSFHWGSLQTAGLPGEAGRVRGLVGPVVREPLAAQPPVQSWCPWSSH